MIEGDKTTTTITEETLIDFSEDDSYDALLEAEFDCVLAGD